MTSKPVPTVPEVEAPPPALELHRTEAGRHYDPTRSGPMFVLIIGSDIREGDPARGRADSIHILAVDPRRGRGTIVGIPRDSYVPIPGHGTRKINSALFFGGAPLLVRTVEQLAGVEMHYWALIEFSRFRKLVDRLGGVEVDVPYRMADRFSGAYFDPGPRHMNGTEALAFARVRKGIPGGDFGRSFNHGTLMLAGLKRFKQLASSPIRLARVMAAFLEFVESDVPVRELLNLARIGRGLDPSKLTNVVLPGSGGSAGGASVVFLAPGANDIFQDIRDDAVL